MVFEKKKSKVIGFLHPYRVKNLLLETVYDKAKCILNGEWVNEFKYLGSIICNYESIEEETREKVLQGRTMSIEGKKKYFEVV